MRFPLPLFRPRIRLRTLLILVALAASALGGRRLWQRRERCLEMATILDVLTESEESPYTNVFWDGFPPPEFEELIRLPPERLRLLAERYRYVADHPWLPLPREPE